MIRLGEPVPLEEERPEWMGTPGPVPPDPPRPPEVDDAETDVWRPPGGSYRNVRWLPNWRPISHF